MTHVKHMTKCGSRGQKVVEKKGTDSVPLFCVARDQRAASVASIAGLVS